MLCYLAIETAAILDHHHHKEGMETKGWVFKAFMGKEVLEEQHSNHLRLDPSWEEGRGKHQKQIPHEKETRNNHKQIKDGGEPDAKSECPWLLDW